MEKIVFCEVTWMKYYNGVCDDDQPKNGGKYIKENNIPPEDWYDMIDQFIDETKYSKKSKYTYKNDLRNYIENIHYTKKTRKGGIINDTSTYSRNQ